MIPSLREWYSTYGGDDFEIIGVHYPEFNFEKDYNNVVNAVAEFGIEYPVVLDNNRIIWGGWRQRYWPTTYLLDKQGNIRYQHIGEGGYEETERAIQALIAEEFDSQ